METLKDYGKIRGRKVHLSHVPASGGKLPTGRPKGGAHLVHGVPQSWDVFYVKQEDGSYAEYYKKSGKWRRRHLGRDRGIRAEHKLQSGDLGPNEPGYKADKPGARI